MATTSSHYALVNADDASTPLVIPDGSTIGNHGERDTRDDLPREELTRLYEKYAEMYPNPRLVEELRMKNELVHAISAAANAQGSPAVPPHNSKQKRGFLARLFGATEPDDQKSENNEIANENAAITSSNSSDFPLVYKDLPNPNDDASLCGTKFSLDFSCVPQEAVSVARFHLTSQRTRGEHPNAVRWGPLLGRPVPTSLIVVGLGMIAELHPNQSSVILRTSDCDDLNDYSNAHPDEFQLQYVRACGISPNCIAVSWGFEDGLICVYRRIQFPDDQQCGWEQMWLVRPSPPVLDAIGDVFHDDESHPGSPLLRVADLLPLRVTTGVSTQPMVATLALARLGGYLELLPVPSKLWFGPLLTPQNHKRPRIPRRQPGQHYSFGKYIGSPSLSLTTRKQHIDILSIDALRTGVGLESEWNKESFPDGPPCEYIIALSGLSSQVVDRETISFWGVSTLFLDNFEESTHEDIGFQLHSFLLDSTVVNTGADVSVFASPEIMQHWRMARHVELQPDASFLDNYSNTTTKVDEKNTPVTSLSTPVAIVTLQFLDQKGSAVLAVLDGNGGATVLDCTQMEKRASQSLSWEELARIELGADLDDSETSAMKIIVSRNQFARALGIQNRISAIHWLKTETHDQDKAFPIVILLGNTRKLVVVSFSLLDEYGPIADPIPSVASLPFPAEGAIMGDLGSGNVLFISKRRRSEETRLKLFIMQPLQPISIVESLAREGKHKEAIAAAQKLDDLDREILAEVLQDCHRHLWETHMDVDSLADTRNITYIVEQTLLVCRSISSNDTLTLEKVRLLCQLATAMGRNHDPAQESLAEINAFIVLLGTYQLLCRVYAAPSSLNHFRATFLNISIVALAKNIARRGEIGALSIVLFRQRPETEAFVFEILSSIPLPINPEAFVHLLPLVKAGRRKDSFLPSSSNLELHMSQMPRHLLDTRGIQLVIDVKDESVVLERTSRLIDDQSSFALSASYWFHDRSRKLQSFTGNLESVMSLCTLGLRCNGIHNMDKESDTMDDKLMPLYRTWSTTKSLLKLQMDNFEVSSMAADEHQSKKLSLMNTSDFFSSDLHTLVDLIVTEDCSLDGVLARCTDRLRPLLVELKRENHTLQNETALMTYCSDLVADCASFSERYPKESENLLKKIMKALGIILTIASLSATSIETHDRLITDNELLTLVVIQTMRGTSSILHKVHASSEIAKCFIVSYWKLYEAIGTDDPGRTLAHRLLIDLKCGEILSRWPGTKCFQFLSKRLGSSLDLDENDGKDIIKRLCESFFISIENDVGTTAARTLLLEDLLSDFVQIQASVKASIDMGNLLATCVVRPLLHLEHFALVAECCNAKSSIVTSEELCDVITTYMETSIFSDDTEQSQVSAAMTCQDIVIPILPELEPIFLKMRKFLDAAHFIDTVIYEGRPHIFAKPADLRHRLPLDLIEAITRDSPFSVLCGCREWENAEYALSANEVLRSSKRNNGRIMESEGNLPVLPGGAIYHLASLLGLDDSTAALAVKCLVIFHALSVGLHGAAAAICRTIISDGVDKHAAIIAKISAITQLVSDDDYWDTDTKLELCQITIAKYAGHIDIDSHHDFSVLCQICTKLDHMGSRCRRDANYNFPNEKYGGSLNPFIRVQQHILSEYNADVHGLFADLLGQASNGVVHDSLMNAMSRFVIYWCISDSKTLRPRLKLREKIDARENLALGCSLMLHIPSKLTAGNCVHELQKIAADQAVNVANEERFGNEEGCIPDPEIVRRMVHRGYAESAARRAVFMTGNAGYNEALGWAITHTSDLNLDEPIVVVQDAHRMYIDESAIQLLQKSLIATQCWINDEDSLASLLTSLATLRNSDCTMGDTSLEQRLEAPSGIPEESLQQATSKNVASDLSKGQPRSTQEIAAAPRLAQLLLTKPAKKPIFHEQHASNTYQHSLAKPPDKRNGTLSKAPSPVEVKYPSRLASPNNAGQNRSDLLKRGQEALAKRTIVGKNPDRSKLIANGRELFRRVRENSITSTGVTQDNKKFPVPLSKLSPPKSYPTNTTMNGSSQIDNDPKSTSSGRSFDSQQSSAKSSALEAVPCEQLYHSSKISSPKASFPSDVADQKMCSEDNNSTGSGWSFDDSPQSSVKLLPREASLTAQTQPESKPSPPKSQPTSMKGDESPTGHDDNSSEGSGWSFDDSLDEI